MFRAKLRQGFTIVELLIVIVVIGLLSVIVMAAFANSQQQARAAKVKSDIRMFEKAILSARENTSKPTKDITNNGCTKCSCPYAAGDTTKYDTLPKTHNCWTRYYDALTAIGNASNSNLSELRDGDPWGSPYLLDENEGEQVATPCSRDNIVSAGAGKNVNAGTNIGGTNIRLSLPQCV